MVFVDFKKLIILILAVVLITAGFLFYKTSSTISVVNISEKSFWENVTSLFEDYQDRNRIDVLLMGIRGRDDPNGGLLADGMMLISFHKEKSKAAMVSIPRDLYVEIPGIDGRERLNFANAYGEAKKRGGGLLLTKALVSNITGVNIDYAVSVDFRAFKEVVDWLGGIIITLEKPFTEEQQWMGEGIEKNAYWKKKEDDSGWVFYIPEGKNNFDGETALYYVRSRYSTSDFDRSRRQQEVLLAIKDKALTLNLLQNSHKIFALLDILKKNVQSDMSLGDMKELITLAKSYENISNIKRITIDSSENGLLYEDYTENGNYILLPKSGDWKEIKTLVRNVFEE